MTSIPLLSSLLSYGDFMAENLTNVFKSCSFEPQDWLYTGVAIILGFAGHLYRVSGYCYLLPRQENQPCNLVSSSTKVRDTELIHYSVTCVADRA